MTSGPQPTARVRRTTVSRADSGRRMWTGLLVVVAVVVGLVIGRSTVQDGAGIALRALEREVLPVVLDADAVWLGASGETGSVSGAIASLRAGDPGPVVAGAATWIAAYDTVLVRLVGVELPDPARPIQRQFVAGITLSRDAVEVLARAAEVPAGRHRADLVDEAVRLRMRSEQLVLAARASAADLDGSRRRIASLPAIPVFGAAAARGDA
jgi:hypothetical protein